MVVVGPLNSSIRANLYISVISYKMVLAISTPRQGHQRDVFSDVSHTTIPNNTPSMTSPCLTCSSVSHNLSHNKPGKWLNGPKEELTFFFF